MDTSVLDRGFLSAVAVLADEKTAAYVRDDFLKKVFARNPKKAVHLLLRDTSARLCLERAVDGKEPIRGLGPTTYTRCLKLIEAAKQYLAERQKRRRDFLAAKAAANGNPGHLLRQLQHQWRERALETARKWAEKTGTPLFRSKRATITYGRGGKSDYDTPYGGQFKGWTANWKNAGARLDDENFPKFVIIENHLGKEIARVKFPRPRRRTRRRPTKEAATATVS